MELPEKRRDLALLDRSVDTVQAFKRTLDPAAVNEMARFRETQARIIHWVRDYLVRIGFNMKRDHLVATLNPYNITSGLGLQSVSLQVIREPRFFGKPRERLLPGQSKAPTIGIFSPDILPKGARSGVARFPVDKGGKETISALSPVLHMGDESGLDEVSGLPKLLHRDGEPLVVRGPYKVVTVCHQVQTPERIVDAVQRGVYACEYGVLSRIEKRIMSMVAEDVALEDALREEATRTTERGGF